MTKNKQIEVLKETIKWFKKQIKPRDSGWMYTTIDGLKHRISVLRKEIRRVSPDILLEQDMEVGGETVKVDIPMTVGFFWPAAE